MPRNSSRIAARAEEAADEAAAATLSSMVDHEQEDGSTAINANATAIAIVRNAAVKVTVHNKNDDASDHTSGTVDTEDEESDTADSSSEDEGDQASLSENSTSSNEGRSETYDFKRMKKVAVVKVARSVIKHLAKARSTLASKDKVLAKEKKKAATLEKMETSVNTQKKKVMEINSSKADLKLKHQEAIFKMQTSNAKEVSKMSKEHAKVQQRVTAVRDEAVLQKEIAMSKAIDKDRIIKEMKENLKMAQSTIKEKDALISLYMKCDAKKEGLTNQQKLK